MVSGCSPSFSRRASVQGRGLKVRSPIMSGSAAKRLSTAEMLAAARLSDDAAAIRQDGMSMFDFLDALIQGGFFHDSIRWMSQLLPARERAWWLCLCTRHALGGTPSSAEQKVLQAAARWVRDASEGRRRAAEQIADTEDESLLSMPACRLATMSGTAPASDQPALPPRPAIASRFAASGLLTLARRMDGNPAIHVKQFLVVGHEVLRGANDWKD